jgi:hypothetical protein
MKNICVLLIILILQPNSYLSAGKESPFSFEDFLQQIEQDLSNKTQKQEQEIIDVLEKQIKPIANDLSKIVKGPEAEKALEEKKKQREQKQKEAEKRLDQMRRQRPSSYYPSYRTPSTGRYTPSYKSGRDDYRPSDYDGYKPKSSWDKYWDKYYKDAEKDKFATDTKPAEKERGTGAYQAEEKKGVKKHLTIVKNLTKEINETLTKLIKSPPSTKNLATSNTFALLKEKFDKRENARSAISEKDEKHKKELDETLGKEKSQWLAFLPQMVKAITFAEKTPDSSEMVSAQGAGRALLSSLQLKGYVTEASVSTLFFQHEKVLATALKNLDAKYAKKEDPAIKDAIDVILKQANKITEGPRDTALRSKAPKGKTQPNETDPILNRINALTRRLKNIIGKATKGIKAGATTPVDIDKNKKIYKNLVTTGKIFTKIRKLFDRREVFIDELEDPEKFIKKEGEFWLGLIPTLLQAITYKNDTDKAMTEEQKRGEAFLEELLDIGYVAQEKVDKEKKKLKSKA